MLKWGSGKRVLRRTGAGLLTLLNDGNTQAWYRPGLGVTGTLNASAWTDFMGTGHDLAQGTGANQPIYLPFTGEKYGWLPGASGNYFSTPDAVANRITGDIAIAARIALDDFTPASTVNHICCKWGGVGASAWQFRVAQTTGVLAMLSSSDGTNVAFTSSSTSAPVVSDAAKIWVLVTVDVDDGAGNNKVTFYTAADQASIPTTWAQLGDVVTNVGTTSFFNASTPVTLGSAGTSGTLSGKAYRCALFSGIPAFAGGAGSNTPVQDYNGADWAETSTNGATQASSATGEVWTLNSTGAKPAQIVGSPSLLFDGTADYLQTADFILNQPISHYIIFQQITWAADDKIFDGNGTVGAQVNQWNLTPKLNIACGADLIESTSNLPLVTYGIVTAIMNGASSVLQINNNTATTGNAGTNAMGGLTLGAAGDGTVGTFGNIQAKEWIVRSVADSAATRLSIQQRLAASHGISI